MRYLRNIIAAAVLAVSAQAMADNYSFLNISQNVGEASFQVSQIERITFDSGKMIVHLTDGSTQELETSSLQKMVFSATGSQGIGTIAFDENKIHIDDGQLRLQLDEGEKAFIYNMKGEMVYTTNRSGVFQLDNLKKGVYIIRVGNVTKKVMTK
jgi:hypothetical protein